MPISSLYLLGRAVGYRERARKARELASAAPAEAERLTDLASSLERKASDAEERAWLVDAVPAQSRQPRFALPAADHRVRILRPAFRAG
jgi:hypothetical protein